MTELKVLVIKEDPVIEDSVTVAVKSFKDKTPAYWTIVPVDDDQVSCKNSFTNETFVGTLEEFNTLLRG